MNEETTEKRVPCMVMSRVVGYISMISSWNKGKVQEFKDRIVYGQPTRERLEGMRGKDEEK